LGNEIWGDFYSTSWFQGIVKVMSKGNYGVSLFFVLSGFLITYLLLHEAKTKKSINTFGFFMRRLLRIWPVYFLVILFGFVIYPLLPHGIETTNSPVFYSLFLSNFEEIRNGWQDAVNFLTVTWSVSIEEQFYIGWVVLMALLPPFRKGKFFPIYFGVLILSSVAFRVYAVDDERMLYYHTLSVVSDLAIGGYLSYTSFHYNWLDRFKSLSKLTTLLIYIGGTGLILGGRIIFKGDLIIIEKLFIGLFFAFVIFDQAFGKHSFFKADKIPGFFKLGEISYGMYMYHCIVIYYIQILFAQMGWVSSPLHFFGALILSFGITVALSKVSYRLMEQPLLRFKKHFR
jgi:peptidoglycan/LPS O-acetylase OafA/YrhL